MLKSDAPKPGKTVELQLLAINDLPGNLEPPPGSGGRVNVAPVAGSPATATATVNAGGVAFLADHLDELRAEAPHSLTVAAGDMVGASPLISALFHDEPTIEALDLLGLDVTAVGSHAHHFEFASGSAVATSGANGAVEIRSRPSGAAASRAAG